MAKFKWLHFRMQEEDILEHSKPSVIVYILIKL